MRSRRLRHECDIPSFLDTAGDFSPGSLDLLWLGVLDSTEDRAEGTTSACARHASDCCPHSLYDEHHLATARSGILVLQLCLHFERILVIAHRGMMVKQLRGVHVQYCNSPKTLVPARAVTGSRRQQKNILQSASNLPRPIHSARCRNDSELKTLWQRHVVEPAALVAFAVLTDSASIRDHVANLLVYEVNHGRDLYGMFQLLFLSQLQTQTFCAYLNRSRSRSSLPRG